MEILILQREQRKKSKRLNGEKVEVGAHISSSWSSTMSETMEEIMDWAEWARNWSEEALTQECCWNCKREE